MEIQAILCYSISITSRKDGWIVMKKRLIALLLCMILCLTVLPVCAFAGEGLTAAGTSVSPLTGDESNVVLWIVVGAVALAGIVGIVLYLMKRKK